MAIAQEIKGIAINKPVWQRLMLLTLVFWMSSSLMLDLVIMPILYATGMMAEPGFAVAGYSLFWVFNRVELLCAALVLTCTLIIRQSKIEPINSQSIVFATLLFGAVLICTYGLAPQMSGLGLQLNLFNSIQEAPALMNVLHTGYWLMEVMKLALGGVLVGSCWKLND
jgi:hypothetical protein